MKIKNIISDILILFIIVVLLNICYSKFILKDDLIKVFGKSFLIVTTGSMQPEICAGELIVITEKNNYKKDDIVTYKYNENILITHRIININEKNFIAKGDSNNLEDEEILNSNIKGKVIYHSKILGFFVLYILKPLVAIYISFFIFMNFYLTYKERKNVSNNIKEEDNEKISST